MDNFTPWSALPGGALIGLGASLLLLLNGRIAGISGIFNGVLRPQAGDTGWRVLFLVGLVLGTALYAATATLPFVPREGYPPVLLAAAGFLVGAGTRMGSGCTSGHGVCGVARASRRSLVATLTFLVAGALTASLVTPHLAGASI